MMLPIYRFSLFTVLPACSKSSVGYLIAGVFFKFSFLHVLRMNWNPYTVPTLLVSMPECDVVFLLSRDDLAQWLNWRLGFLVTVKIWGSEMLLALHLMVSSSLKTKRPAYFGFTCNSWVVHLVCELRFEILPGVMFSSPV